jgi:hypothetical protein
MNLFELATLISPVGGAVGGALAVHQAASSTPAWMWIAIPVGLACGVGLYRGLIQLAIGRHDKNPNMPGWRLAAILGVTYFSPYISGALSYGLVRLLLYVVA